MKKLITQLLVVVCLGLGSNTYAQLTFTVTSNLGFTLTCANPAILLQATSNYTPAQPTYTFFSPSNQMYTSNAVSVIVPGTWTVSAMAGTATASQTLAVFINTVAPTITLTASGASITCLNPTVMLSALTTPSNPTFSWIEPGVGVGCTTSTCMAAAPGLYGVNAVDPINGCSSTSSIQVSDGRSYPVFDAVSLFTVSCPGGTVNLNPTVLTPTTGISFKWLSPAGAVTSGSNTPVLNTNAPGVYSLAVTNTVNGCITQTLVNVWACVGIYENGLKGQVKVYPNPAEDHLIIDLKALPRDPLQASIINTLGQILSVTECNSDIGEINLSSLKSGIYYLQLSNDSGTIVRKTFCIAKP